jgi:hypothetical protein
MDKLLQLALRNANGLAKHTEELKTFISIHNIDIMLISETHFTSVRAEYGYPKVSPDTNS